MKERGNNKLRFLDRYFGIPLLLFFALFKRKRMLPKEITTIALYKSAGIGDVVLLSGIIEDIKEAYSKAKIILFTGTSNVEMGRLIEGIEVVALPIVKPFTAIKMIRERKATLFLDFDLWPRSSALFTFFSGAEYTFGHKTRKQYRHFLYDYVALHSHDCHQLENFRKLLHPLGINPSHLPEVKIKECGVQKRVFVFHILCFGARAKLREWPKEKWQELMDFLGNESVDVILTGSKEERAFLESVRAGRKGVINLAGMLSLEETAKLLKQSLGLVSVDTGIMHLAAAVRLPVIALHGPSSEKRWGAIGPYVEIVTPKIACRPCLSLGFDSTCTHNRCMELISVDEVKDRVARIINEEYSNESSHSRGRLGVETLASIQT